MSNYITIIILLAVLIWHIPQLIQGLLSGSPSMGASDLANVAKQGASVGMAAAGAGLGLASVGASAGAGKMSMLSNIGGGIADFGKGAFNMAMGNKEAAMSTAAAQAGINAVKTSALLCEVSKVDIIP